MGPPPPPPSPSSQAIAALVLGIVSWVGCACFTGIPAIIVARNELGAIERGESPPAGKGLAQAGFWLGVVNTILYAFVLVIYVFAMALGFAGALR
jgi:ABC-type sugar transport system permease subunit